MLYCVSDAIDAALDAQDRDEATRPLTPAELEAWHHKCLMQHDALVEADRTPAIDVVATYPTPPAIIDRMRLHPFGPRVVIPVEVA